MFKYVSEILTMNVNESAVSEDMTRKMEIAFTLCLKTTNPNHEQGKFRHYCMVVKPQSLYVAETVARKGSLWNRKERKNV